MAADRMVVGTLSLKLAIFGAYCLKDKRRVVRSLKDRLQGKFNISVAEVGSLDRWQQAEVGIAMVANDGQFLKTALAKIVDYVRQDTSASLVDYQIEVF